MRKYNLTEFYIQEMQIILKVKKQVVFNTSAEYGYFHLLGISHDMERHCGSNDEFETLASSTVRLHMRSTEHILNEQQYNKFILHRFEATKSNMRIYSEELN